MPGPTGSANGRSPRSHDAVGKRGATDAVPECRESDRIAEEEAESWCAPPGWLR